MLIEAVSCHFKYFNKTSLYLVVLFSDHVANNAALFNVKYKIIGKFENVVTGSLMEADGKLQKIRETLSSINLSLIGYFLSLSSIRKSMAVVLW